MKNPRVIAARFAEAGALSLILQGDIQGNLSTLSSGETFLKNFLKFTDADIARATEMATALATASTVVGVPFAAVSIAKEVLTFLGALDTKDPTTTALEALGKKVQSIYSYLANQEKKQLFTETLTYRGKVGTIRKAIDNMMLSRSGANLATLTTHVEFLQETIEAMLDPGKGNNAFLRQAYGYGAPNHWIDVATPFYMSRTDFANPTVDYADPDRELAVEIWDPGYYLDLLIPAIGVRLAALEVTEPAYRSTGYQRTALAAIHDGLESFIAAWNRSFFATNIVGPIDPNPVPYREFLKATQPAGGHRIAKNPFDSTYFGVGGSASIALGCVDPVSGIAIMEPEYRDGFVVRESHLISKSGGPMPGFYVLDNYDQAIANARARQGAMMHELRERCGILRFYELKDAVFRLMNLTSSEFVNLTDATFSSDGLQQVGPVENLDLGVVGAFAGKAGKKYPAVRYRQQVVKRFRIPMARRTDASQIQLGYRLVVGVGGTNGDANIVLCAISQLDSPFQSVDFFPTGSRVAMIEAPDAIVYDVIQSDIFSVAEEDAFEASGATARKRRIYVNPRAGGVALKVAVTFQFDINDRNHAFSGFADVEVSSVDHEANGNGFIASVDVYETLPGNLGEPPREHLADQMSLHFATSFLVAPDDYFVDRDEGYAEMERTFRKVSEKYAKSAVTLAIDPIARVSQRAQVEKAIGAFAETQLREHPRQMHTMLARLQVRQPSSH